MGAFQDTDGTGYVLLNGGDVYRLASDYHSAATLVASGVSTGGESPAMFKAGNTYFFLFNNELKYASPILASGAYTLSITVVGAHGTWTDKAGTVFGSTGNYVSIDRAVVSN